MKRIIGDIGKNSDKKSERTMLSREKWKAVKVI